MAIKSRSREQCQEFLLLTVPDRAGISLLQIQHAGQEQAVRLVGPQLPVKIDTSICEIY